MIATLLKEGSVHSITLPMEPVGQYWIEDTDIKGRKRHLLSVEEYKGDWIIRSNPNAVILSQERNYTQFVKLRTDISLSIRIVDDGQDALLFTEKISEGRNRFNKYLSSDSVDLYIGRSEECDICFQNTFVSSQHALLRCLNGQWSIVDLNSTNGTYVNGRRIQNFVLHAGDVIFIMGLQIVIGNVFISINNPDGNCQIHTEKLQGYLRQGLNSRKEDFIKISEENYFHRAPSFRKEITEYKVKIDAPPEMEKQDTTPLGLLIGPSMTMGLAAMSMGGFTVANVVLGDGNIFSAMPSVVMSFSMVLGSVLWPVLTKKHERKQKRENESLRQSRYYDYLQRIRDDLIRQCRIQENILKENETGLDDCIQKIVNKRMDLWERAYGSEDFLRVRLGIGNVPMLVDISCPEQRFSINDDNLLNSAYALAEEEQLLRNVPITISMAKKYICGIIGKYDNRMRFLKHFILQIIARHSYDEVKIVLMIEENDYEHISYVKWLPHLWSDNKSRRFLAINQSEVREISAYLEKEMVARTTREYGEKKEPVPHYILISTSRTLANKADVVSLLLKQKEMCGFSYIVVAENISQLPKECLTIMDIQRDTGRVYEKAGSNSTVVDFYIDKTDLPEMEKVAFSLANTPLDLSDQKYILPKMLTFLEMFKVGKMEYLNPLVRWKENDPTVSLQAPIGVDTIGGLFYLDLHERFHGPHGLVAGMTGSGKSEFIITYILSMAVNYHPDEVAFILIDYKGGGLAGAFEDADRGIKLPHLAGTITNLDGAAVNRSLISIQSELRRRQRIFNEARKISNDGTMDIYRYQKLRREGVVTEAVPHLFIISDEFAELKTQQPEFMEQLISAARIGRSLGVHLILATQKPSGVVNDQIWSNSRFRICLKVQERSDSMEMIKRPDAAEIAETGRFYLQVGFNELFELGQSAWCGATYIPAERVTEKVDNNVCVVDNLGRVIKETGPTSEEEKQIGLTTQIVSIVQYLSELAVKQGISVRKLWMDPIPAKIYIDALESKYGYVSDDMILNPVIGELDDPFNQKQALLTLPITSEGNAIIYGSVGSGKGMILNAILYSLLKTHSAETLNLYLVDFGTENLRAFKDAPQVGDVIFSSEEEKLQNMLHMVKQEMEQRKRRYADYGGNLASYVQISGEKDANILIVINNFIAFTELYEDLETEVATLSREGTKYGIYFILTSSNVNGVRYRMQQNFKQMLVLQLNDVSDYPVITGPTRGVMPSKYKGRGILRLDKVYEFQTASIADVQNQQEWIRQFCSGLADGNYFKALTIPVLPERVTLQDFANIKARLDKVPVGISVQEIQPRTLDVYSRLVLLITGRQMREIRGVVAGILEILPYLCKVTVIDLAGDLQKQINTSTMINFAGQEPETFIADVFYRMLDRHKQFKESGRIRTDWNDETLVVYGLKPLADILSADGLDKLFVLMERTRVEYGMHYIIVDEIENIAAYAGRQWVSASTSAGGNLWVGNGISSQNVLKNINMNNQLYAEIERDYGYILGDGSAELVKLLQGGMHNG